MHPMERLRHVARARLPDPGVVARESAAALAALGDDGAGLLLSCRRLLERHPASGPLWWLCARAVCADDARAEAWRCAEELDGDPTTGRLALEVPDDATIAVVGWPEVAAGALARRGDLRALVVDGRGDGAALARRLRAVDVDAVDVDDAGAAPAVAASDLVVLEAAALGPTAFVAAPGSWAAAAVAHHAGIPVWLVAGVGRSLPPGLWAALSPWPAGGDPWTAAEEVVPLDLVDAVVRPGGLVALSGGTPLPADCSDVPELL
ncbi:MAG: hypothetical protein ACR2K0_09350 [Acidimicrobiales bacterium]